MGNSFWDSDKNIQFMYVSDHFNPLTLLNECFVNRNRNMSETWSEDLYNSFLLNRVFLSVQNFNIFVSKLALIWG